MVIFLQFSSSGALGTWSFFSRFSDTGKWLREFCLDVMFVRQLFYNVFMITLILLLFRASAPLKEEDQISQQKDETKVTTENGAIPKSPKSPDAATLEKILTTGGETPL